MSLKLSRLSLVWVSVLTVTLGVVIFPQPALAQRAIGVDVSSYQGASVNWATLKADGVSFAWAKGAEGTSTDGYVGEDPDFVTNEKNAKAAGVPIGPYYFARGLTDTGTAGADTEAAYFWSVAGSYMIADGKSIQPMLDFEVNGVASESTWVNEWCNDIVSDGKANGVVLKPLFYSDGSISSGMASSVTQWLLDIGDPSGA